MIPHVNPYQLLGQIARNQSEIKLLNIFKGLPISYDVQINAVNDSEIQVRSNKYQLACLFYQRETYLQGNELPFTLRSQVTSLHLGREEATLTNLEVAQKGIGERSQIRVEPNEPFLVAIKFEDSSVDFFALVADISSEGAGVYFESFMFPSRLCKVGSEIAISISLPDNNLRKTKKLPTRTLRDRRTSSSSSQTDLLKDQDGNVTITTRGKVVSVSHEFLMERYRVGLRLHFKDLSRAVILQYIAQRQTEIIRDLSILSDDLYIRKNS